MSLGYDYEEMGTGALGSYTQTTSYRKALEALLQNKCVHTSTTPQLGEESWHQVAYSDIYGIVYVSGDFDYSVEIVENRFWRIFK